MSDWPRATCAGCDEPLRYEDWIEVEPGVRYHEGCVPWADPVT